MAQFSFSLIGSAQPLVLDVRAGDLAALGDQMVYSRFVEGDLLTHGGELVRVLLPVSRVQFVSEVCG